MQSLSEESADELPLLASVVWGTLKRDDKGYLFRSEDECPRTEVEEEEAPH